MNQQHPLNHFLIESTGLWRGPRFSHATAKPIHTSWLPESADPRQSQEHFPVPALWDTWTSPGVGIPQPLSWVRVEQQTRHSSCSCKASCDAHRCRGFSLGPATVPWPLHPLYVATSPPMCGHLNPRVWLQRRQHMGTGTLGGCSTAAPEPGGKCCCQAPLDFLG